MPTPERLVAETEYGHDQGEREPRIGLVIATLRLQMRFERYTEEANHLSALVKDTSGVT